MDSVVNSFFVQISIHGCIVKYHSILLLFFKTKTLRDRALLIDYIIVYLIHYSYITTFSIRLTLFRTFGDISKIEWIMLCDFHSV